MVILKEYKKEMLLVTQHCHEMGKTLKSIEILESTLPQGMFKRKISPLE